jgi:hypothetical protein
MRDLSNFVRYSLGIASFLGFVASLLTFSPVNPVAAQSSGEEINNVDASFLCKRTDQGWMTIVNSSLRHGNDVAFIVYKSNYFRNAGYDNQKRCQMVSRRLNELFHNGQLDYVTSGIVNRQPVICGVRSNSETCARYNVILTLKSREDAVGIIQQFFELKSGNVNSNLIQVSAQDSEEDRISQRDGMKIEEPTPTHIRLSDIIRNAPSP